jgi:anti-anti-sigma factor
VPGCVVLSVLGEIDLVTAPDLAEGIAEQLSGTPRLVVDLSGVSFFGSLGLATLIHAVELAEERDVQLTLVPGPLVRRTMDLTRTAEYFTVFETVTEALQ